METRGVRTGGNEPERLRVYHLALHLFGQVNELLKRARCSLPTSDQTRRAAGSIVLNIAEGAAHRRAGMKIRHYDIARASAGEFIACLALIRKEDPTAWTSPARRNAQQVSRMLASLIEEWERKKKR